MSQPCKCCGVQTADPSEVCDTCYSFGYDGLDDVIDDDQDHDQEVCPCCGRLSEECVVCERCEELADRLTCDVCGGCGICWCI